MQHAPAEIINEIFKHVVSDVLVVHRPRAFPWYLGQVCASWRAEFTSTSWIWRKFIIHDVDYIAEHELADVARLIKLCIHRSKSQPLSFSFCWTREFLPSNKRPYINLMLSDLLTESDRWEAIEVKTDIFYLEAFPCLPLLSNRFPLLRSVSLRSNGNRWNKPKFRDFFLHAENLTHVEIDRFPSYNFNWPRLTVLTLHDASNVADILVVLRRLCCIAKLHLNAIFVKSSGIPDENIVLPTLKVLTCAGEVMRHIRAPALEEFHMNIEPSAPLSQGTISFLQTSSSTLTQLTLGHPNCSPEYEALILQHLPNVITLILGTSDSESLGLLLCNPEDKIPILPKLELLVTSAYLLGKSADMLCAIVTSRTNNPSLLEWPCRNLKELRITGYRKTYNSHLRGLELLCEERKVKFSLEKASHYSTTISF